ncbi:hypothetical protein CANCADRAFT_73695 [Tortispora caseinolytica NRRL Y-17796]|uniref:UspA domain-containing protein n=1 Tax=Tortispora caseinolytica NRRL Y-17796 TaxID=767744 RepID=A0A1E4TIX8_9ASCO|nr:hypothetical protein CANCADRAFT_73695 [Tortispora caseinolytica NRRL Y-17796]
MSLEAAIEEERLEIVKLLEEYERRKSAPDRFTERSTSSSKSRAMSQADPVRPKSLLIGDDDVPTNSQPKPKPMLVDPPKVSVDRVAEQLENFSLNPIDSAPIPSLSISAPGGDRARSTSSHGMPRNLTPSSVGSNHRTSSQSRRKSSSSNFRSSSRSPSQGEMDFSNAFLKLSDANLAKAGGTLGNLVRSSSAGSSPDVTSRLYNDESRREYEDEEAIQTSSDDDDYEDVSDSSSSDLDGLNASIFEAGPTVARAAPSSLLGALEEERKTIASSKYKVKSLFSDDPRPGYRDIDNYGSYKRRFKIRPHSAFNEDESDDEDTAADEYAPYTSDVEEMVDRKHAANLDISISAIQSTPEAQRVIRTVTRGKPPSLEESSDVRRSYLIPSDLSPEAAYALEWTIGTVLRDGNILYLVYAIEEPDSVSDDASSAMESERLASIETITQQAVSLLKRTKLQVNCVLEVLHCKNPKHVLTEIIDYLDPTMVIVGSRGRSALKGVLLGSFSNYLVSKSSVPVMVARRRLKKSKHGKHMQVKMSNNFRASDNIANVKLI